MKKIYSLFLVLLISASVVSSVRIGDLYYDLNNTSQTAIVTYENWDQYAIHPNNYNDLREVHIPETITYGDAEYKVTCIGRHAFDYCKSLYTITIPNSVTSINEYAFYRSGIKSIKLPYRVETIGERAFSLCSSLKTIEIPVSVSIIGYDAFSTSVGRIDTIKFTGNLREWYEKNWLVNDISSSYQLYINGELVTIITIPDTWTYIPAYLFNGCSSLHSVEIQNGVKEIGNNAFENCAGLTSVNIPHSVTSIESNAFANCRNLISVEIPDSIKVMKNEVFANCSNLTDVTLGKSVSNIENSPFYKCSVHRLTVLATTPPSGGINSGIDNSKCILFVPEENIETYSNATWWKDFSDIRTIGSLPIVKFFDWDGTLIASVEVDKGTAATPPANPTREGYTFVGWDLDYSNVTEDMTITAQYEINRYEVKFLDWDGSVLHVDSVEWDTYATFPDNPHRKGYTFTGWCCEILPIWYNTTYTAEYRLGEDTDISITFVDGSDYREILTHNAVLQVPAAPEIEGFTFLRWETRADNIENGITIQAIYEANEPLSTPNEISVPHNSTQKLIRNGNIYILTDTKTYNVQGAEVR